jgi:hypothetical protein
MRSSFGRAMSLLAVGLLTCIFAVSAVAAGEQGRGSFARTFKVNGPVQLHLDTGAGDVVVRAGDPGTVLVKGVIHIEGSLFGEATEAEEKAHYFESNPPIRQEGNLIRIGAGQSGEEGSGQIRAFPKYVSIDYELNVPADTQLAAKSGSGDFLVAGIQGPVRIEDGSGDLKLDSVRGTVRITTQSGDVSLERSGSNGIEVETGSGDITLRLPAPGGFDLNLQTASGDISIDPQFEVERSVSKKHVQGKVRGGGARVQITTGSGDIRVK